MTNLNKDESIVINCKITITEFQSINRFLNNTNDDTDTEIVKSILKDVHDKVYDKAAYLENLGNNFVESI